METLTITSNRRNHILDPSLASGAITGTAERTLNPARFKDSPFINRPWLAAASNGRAAETDAIQHLLARASFGVTVAEMQTLGASPTAAIVDALLSDAELPAPPGDWITEPFDRQAFQNLSQEERQAWQMRNRERINELRAWWLEWMMASPINLREKMTLFWHGHFTSSYKDVNLAQFLFKQNDTLRRHALGNFRAFLKDIYKDPAMLIYLDGVSNHKNQPNENFARELLELFTMGVGHYSEEDIKQAARAFSGWQVDTISLSSFLNPNRHDAGMKTFFGLSGNFGGDDIIDIILEQPQTAIFICRTLYEFFVSREVDDNFVESLANAFRAADYEIKPLLSSLLRSEHFYSEHARAALIKSPVEMAVSNARGLSVSEINFNYLINAATALDQELLNPPNVAGWPGQRSWISPTTYVLRNTFSESFVNGGLFRDPENNRSPIKFEPLPFAHSFGIEKASELVDAMAAHLLRFPIDEKTRETLRQVLVGTADPNDWSLNYPGADKQVISFLIQLMRLPEFQLT